MGRVFLICILSCLCLALEAQIKIVPREKLEAMSSPRLSDAAPVLHFETNYLKADPMSEDDGVQIYSFPFENRGADTVRIARLVVTCSCVMASCEKKYVLPSEKSEIVVRYNPKGHPGRFERKIFVYTEAGDVPSAVLRLSVEVERGTDMAGLYPIAMGNIRLRRNEITILKGTRSVERCTFVNVSNRPLKVEAEKALLPPCLTFKTEPETVAGGEEGEIVITYDPSRGGERDKMAVILKGMGVPPSQSKITVTLKE